MPLAFIIVRMRAFRNAMRQIPAETDFGRDQLVVARGVHLPIVEAFAGGRASLVHNEGAVAIIDLVTVVEAVSSTLFGQQTSR